MAQSLTPGSQMKVRMTRHLNVLGAAALIIAAVGFTVGCNNDGTSGGPFINSNTNWLLACSGSSDCPSDLSCECGQCTITCDDDSACSNVGTGTCASPGSDAFDRFCQPLHTPICLPDCQDDLDCGDNYACQAGSCIPTWTQPQATPVRDTGSTDAQDDVDSGTLQDTSVDSTTDAEDPCPSGLTFHCGQAIGDDRSSLFECVEGVFMRVEVCDGSCVTIPGLDDACVRECLPGSFPFCGTDYGLPDGFLYDCLPAGIIVRSECPFGCFDNPTSEQDSCIPP